MPRGGRRPGAGAPRHNLNAVRDGFYTKSDTLRRAAMILAVAPEVRALLLAVHRSEAAGSNRLFEDSMSLALHQVAVDPTFRKKTPPRPFENLRVSGVRTCHQIRNAFADLEKRENTIKESNAEIFPSRASGQAASRTASPLPRRSPAAPSRAAASSTPTSPASVSRPFDFPQGDPSTSLRVSGWWTGYGSRGSRQEPWTALAGALEAPLTRDRAANRKTLGNLRREAQYLRFRLQARKFITDVGDRMVDRA